MHRRGYLLYDPTVTGKSSLALALASEFKLHLCIVLKKKLSATALFSLFANLPERCIILLEDIDAAGFATW
jgi:mitochondrial chaperone BCS1